MINTSLQDIEIHIIGTGFAGLTCATACQKLGANIHLYEQSSGINHEACSHYAGGMLAPWCEQESAEIEVLKWGSMAALPDSRRPNLLAPWKRN